MNQMVDIRSQAQAAVLDAAHLGDIEGALGTIYQHDTKARLTWRHRFATLLAILGPGLIVMAGDNDAGAFATYAQAGQNYGTTLLWTLLLLVPVLYVNQEMVLRLGAVTGVGHARLILERFGKFWGAFSVIDLFLLNALTIVTEFIGITPGARRISACPRLIGVAIAAALTILARQHRQLPAVRAVRDDALLSAACCSCRSVHGSSTRRAQMARDFVAPRHARRRASWPTSCC